MRCINDEVLIAAQELDIIQVWSADLTFSHEPKTPAMFPFIAACRFEFRLVFHPMLAQIVAVFYLAEHRRENRCRCDIAPVPDQHVRGVGMASTMVVIIRSLDWLLFERLDIRIEIQQQKEVALKGGLERGHRSRSGVIDQSGKIAIVFWDDSCWHRGNPD